MHRATVVADAVHRATAVVDAVRRATAVAVVDTSARQAAADESPVAVEEGIRPAAEVVAAIRAAEAAGIPPEGTTESRFQGVSSAGD